MLVHVKIYRDGSLILEGEQDFEGTTKEEAIANAEEFIHSKAFGEVTVEAEVVGGDG